MSILNDLIKVKTSTQEDDLLKMLDEMSVYEKLSVNEEFKDMKSSEVVRKRCPMLAAFVDGGPYETVLADLVANIYLQIEGYVPEVLHSTIERTPKQQKQFEILQKGIARISYWELANYNHETMSDCVAAVFTKKDGKLVTAVVIVRSSFGYEMYHGTYTTDEQMETAMSKLKPVVVKNDKGSFVMNTYSILGNNGYRFGTYTNPRVSYDVMVGPYGELFLMSGNQIAVRCFIPHKEQNRLNMEKNDPKGFAWTLLSYIESVV